MFEMFTALFVSRTSRRQSRATARRRLSLEALENRFTPAASNLLWVGELNDDPTAAASWADRDNNGAQLAPKAGDNLTFDPSITVGPKTGKNTAPAAFTTGTDIGDLTLASGFTKNVTITKSTKITGNLSLGNGRLHTDSETLLEIPNASSVITWSGGTLSADLDIGSTTARPAMSINNTFEVTMDTCTISTYGTITWTGNHIAGKGDITIKSGGTFDIQTSKSLRSSNPDSAMGTLSNEGGTIKKATAFTTSVEMNLLNKGQLLLESGTLSFQYDARQDGNASQTLLYGGDLVVTTGYKVRAGLLAGVGTITGNVEATLIGQQDMATVHPGLADSGGTLNVVGQYTLQSQAEEARGSELTCPCNSNPCYKSPRTSLSQAAILTPAREILRGGFGMSRVLLAILTFAVCIPHARATDDNPEPGLFEPFNGKLRLKWDIVRPDEKRYSLTKNKGKLTITTQRGSIHAQTAQADLAKNLFLVKNPYGPDADFEVSVCVAVNKPTANYQQGGLLLYDDDDNYLKFTCEYNSTKKDNKILVFLRETKATSDIQTADPPIDVSKFWLRLTKRKTTYEHASSADGRKWTLNHSWDWGTKGPAKIGIVAKNGGVDVPEIDVTFEHFKLRLLKK